MTLLRQILCAVSVFFLNTGTEVFAQTEYDPDASQIANLNELDYGGVRTGAAGIVFPTVQLDFTVPEAPVAEYDPQTGELVVFDTDGAPHTIAARQNDGESVFPMVIEDAEGKRYQVDAPPAETDAPDGTGGQDGQTGAAGTTGGATGSGGKQTPTVTRLPEAASGFSTSPLDGNAGVVVHFSKGAGRYAFDAAEQPWYRSAVMLRDYYSTLGTYRQGDKTVDYIAPWKLVPTGANDVVEAEMSGAADPDSIRFVLRDGKALAAKREGGKWTLSLPSVGAGETYEVFALYEKGRGNLLTVGKLNVVSYPVQERRVTLVPVFEEFKDAKAVEQELQKIYAPYGIAVTVDVDDEFRREADWSWDGDGDSRLDLNGSGFFSNETAEMKALRQQYQGTGGYDRNSYYVFIATFHPIRLQLQLFDRPVKVAFVLQQPAATDSWMSK